MREKEFYREQLALLNELYPGKVSFTVEEAAKILGVGRRTITAMIVGKKLTATNVGLGRKNKQYLIPKTAIAQLSAG
jgi:excisionase family DNA binding protein